jgi:hypothetical protein
VISRLLSKALAEEASATKLEASAVGVRLRVSDGTRTRDRLDHNQELYLLSYAHHAGALLGATFGI